MNRFISILLCAFLIAVTALPAFATDGADWDKAVRTVKSQKAEAEREAKTTIALVRTQREAMRSELQTSKENARALEKDVVALEREFEALLKQEERLRTELADQQEEMKAVEGTIRTAAKEADTLSRQNPITAEHPDRPLTVRDLLDTDRFPGMAEIEALTDIYFDEIAATGEVRRVSGKFIGPDGKPATGDVLRIGRFAAGYKTENGDTGYLLPDATGLELAAVTGGADANAASALADYLDGKTNILPVDLSSGAVFARIADEQDFFGWLESGGLLIWPIILVGLAALVLTGERLFSLWRIKSTTDAEMDDLNGLAGNSKWDDCHAFCAARKTSPVCRVIDEILRSVGCTRDVLEDAMQEAILRELPRLERFLPTLSVLAAIAPLLGLLGTVTGMINTFQSITIFGTGNPRMMSGGISEALITTQVGLAVAIPIMVAHHLLERRVDAIVGDMEEKGAALALKLVKNGSIGPNAAGQRNA